MAGVVVSYYDDTTGKFVVVSPSTPLPTVGGGGGGGASATASAAALPVVAGVNKPVNLDLFSQTRVLVGDVAGVPVDWTAPVPVTQSGVWTVTQSGVWNITNITGVISLPTGAATEASLVKLPLAQASATAGQNGVLQLASVTTSPPTYVNGNSNAPTLTTLGGTRVAIFSANTSSFVNVAQIGTGTTFPGGSVLFCGAFGMMFNGTSYDRVSNPAATNNTAGIGVTATGLSLFSTSDLTRFRINLAALGDTSIIAAVAAQTIRGHRLRITAAAAVVFQFRDGLAGTVMEEFQMVAGVPVILDLSDRPYFKGTTNTALVINLSLAIQVSGILEYIQAA